MCAKPPQPPPRDGDLTAYLAGKPFRAPSRRMALWDIDGSMQCSIIGTCLTERDLVMALRRNELKAASNASSYDVHSYCVRAAGQDNPLSRSLNKLLDRRYEGAIRIVGQTEDPAELWQVWARFRTAGQIGAAYWALLSHRHVPSELKVAMFGEVHMLSHLNGQGAQQVSLRLADAERRLVEIEARLRRSEQAKSEAIATRDAALLKLNSERSKDRNPSPPRSGNEHRPTSIDARQAKTERALISARARARHAEEALERMRVAEHERCRTRSSMRAPAQLPAPAVSKDGSAAASQRLRILYVGGRPAVVPHLRKAADGRRAELLHHDGGVDDSMHRIEELVRACDVVMCPIDCVSHGACKLAKDTCQRFRKRFVPIATSSFSGFERALDEVVTD